MNILNTLTSGNNLERNSDPMLVFGMFAVAFPFVLGLLPDSYGYLFRLAVLGPMIFALVYSFCKQAPFLFGPSDWDMRVGATALIVFPTFMTTFVSYGFFNAAQWISVFI